MDLKFSHETWHFKNEAVLKFSRLIENTVTVFVNKVRSQKRSVPASEYSSCQAALQRSKKVENSTEQRIISLGRVCDCPT